MKFKIDEEVLYGNIKMKICAIAWLGERYYFLIDKHKTITMVPEDCINKCELNG